MSVKVCDGVLGVFGLSVGVFRVVGLHSGSYSTCWDFMSVHMLWVLRCMLRCLGVGSVDECAGVFG